MAGEYGLGAYGLGAYGVGAYGVGQESVAGQPPQYRIQLRDHSLNPIGEVPDWIDADLLLKFNDVGAFVVTVRADSPLLAAFAAGNGVIISRDRGDGSGAQTLLSGPIWHLERRGRDNTYLLAGPSDEWWLKARRADPVTIYPYQALTLGYSGILRAYRLNETSGTVAVDSSPAAQNGTIAGTVSYATTPGAIDDADACMSFPGTSGYVSIPATGLPTGSGAFTLRVWLRLAALDAGFHAALFLGTATNGQSAHIALNAAGKIEMGVWATAYMQPITPTVGTWYHCVLTYTGGANGTYTAYVNGAQLQTLTATGALTYGGAFLGASSAATNLWHGDLDEAYVGNVAWTAAQVAQDYAVGISRYASAAYDIRTGVASTVMQGYVNANAGPGAVAARRVSGLALATDPAIGSSVTGNARFDNLLSLLQQLAVSGGDIGFRVVQTNNGVLTFSIYQPATKSNAIFSRDLGNLLDFTYTLDGPQANQDVAAGGGQGVSRTFQANSNAASVATWGLVEGFIDARDTSDLPTMQQRISADLAQNQQVTSLSITPQDTAALQFGRDYNLGDVVNVTIDGATITDKVRQIHIQLNGSAQELVTPGIGNAGAGEIAWLFDAKARMLAAIQAQVRRLQATQ